MQEINKNYHIKIVQDLNEFHKLEGPWNSLLENYKSHVPFLCYDWFKIWLRHFLKDEKLFILLLYNGDRLATIAPFLIKNEKFRGIINVSKIELIGNVHSFVRNIIFDNLDIEGKKSNLLIIFNYLLSQFKNWDIIELDSLPEEDLAFAILKEVIEKAGLKRKQYFCFGDWYLDGINYSGSEYMKKRSQNTRKGVGKKKRRMERLGQQVEFQVGTDKDKLDYYMNLYQDVRGKSWKSPEIDIAFLKESRKMAAEKGWLRFGFLFFNKLPVASLIVMVSNTIAYLVEIVYDLKYEEFSPGEIIYAEFLKYLIDAEKITEIDQLRGDEPYKTSWTPKRRERKGIYVFNDTLKGKYLAFLMTRVLPIIENNQCLLSVKNKLLGYLQKHRK